jgi:hypothetical protein
MLHTQRHPSLLLASTDSALLWNCRLNARWPTNLGLALSFKMFQGLTRIPCPFALLSALSREGLSFQAGLLQGDSGLNGRTFPTLHVKKHSSWVLGIKTRKQKAHFNAFHSSLNENSWHPPGYNWTANSVGSTATRLPGSLGMDLSQLLCCNWT